MDDKLTYTFGVGEDDNRVEFPVVTHTGEPLILVDATRVELVTQGDKTIILRIKKMN